MMKNTQSIEVIPRAKQALPELDSGEDNAVEAESKNLGTWEDEMDEIKPRKVYVL